MSHDDERAAMTAGTSVRGVQDPRGGAWTALARRLSRATRGLGPGLVTGAADDDPSGISTYATAGAAFGYGVLWTALFSFPLMAAVQFACARLGIVTGRGLAGVLRARYPRWVVWGACVLLLTANTVNIAADLAGMSDGLALITGVSSVWYHCLFAVLIVALLVVTSYRAMARVLQWLTLVLLAYVGAALLARPPWRAVAAATLWPSLEPSRRYATVLVAILGTTISPYLFFWQASQEVEERGALSRGGVSARAGPRADAMRAARSDVVAGMFASNAIAFFIMLTTAATLYTAGVRDIGSAREAAAALRPLAGGGASLLFALGLIGTGMLGVPVLAGSTAYAIADAGGWSGSMNDRPRQAPVFYAVIALGMLIGMALNHTGVSGFRLLFWSAVLNGVLAPPLLWLILVISNSRRVMGAETNGRAINLLVAAAALVMTLAAGALLL